MKNTTFPSDFRNTQSLVVYANALDSTAMIEYVVHTNNGAINSNEPTWPCKCHRIERRSAPVSGSIFTAILDLTLETPVQPNTEAELKVIEQIAAALHWRVEFAPCFERSWGKISAIVCQNLDTLADRRWVMRPASGVAFVAKL
jgi:hypothetical protein